MPDKQKRIKADRVPPKSKKKPPKFRLSAAIEDICIKTGFSPADALIKAYHEADAVAAQSGISLFDALKLKVDIAKKLTDKIYANKQESKTELTGAGGGPIKTITHIELVPFSHDSKD
jgi:hypothetical protein